MPTENKLMDPTQLARAGLKYWPHFSGVDQVIVLALLLSLPEKWGYYYTVVEVSSMSQEELGALSTL